MREIHVETFQDPWSCSWLRIRAINAREGFSDFGLCDRVDGDIGHWRREDDPRCGDRSREVWRKGHLLRRIHVLVKTDSYHWPRNKDPDPAFSPIELLSRDVVA